jgi:phthiocerol/phenolphthiocerol synthesis type-I polyketide synthase E
MIARSDRISGIAIIGMAGRFPGAPDVNTFWGNLCQGSVSIAKLDHAALAAAGLASDLIGAPNYVAAKGVVEDADCFDAAFFDINPRMAEQLDPQQRLFLECAWHALEDAGYPTEPEGRRVGVFAGSSTVSSYYHQHLLADPKTERRADPFQLMLLNQLSGLPSQVAYRLGLTGPAVAVQTACSTGLMAVMIACQNLIDYQCDLAIAGASSLSLPLTAGYLHQEGSILSPDGRCRPFDQGANGTVPGNGCGAVVLKRLDEAHADRDQIYAVIAGYAANNDGRSKIGFTAPSAEGQAAVVADALAMAGVSPGDISYIETHGTATPVGDAIEIDGLRRVFTDVPSGRCALGAVKANIGHLDAAAGIAGLIKVALAFRHGKLPPAPHFRRPHPELGLAKSPFFVNDHLRPWTSEHGVRCAGVSSFGIGGTNVHVVLTDPPPIEPPMTVKRPVELLALSAASPSSLASAASVLADHLAADEAPPLTSVAATLQSARKALPYRLTVAVRNHEEAAIRLRDAAGIAPGITPTGRAADGIVFLFPGQGAQHPGMAADLYRTEPSFRAEIDHACARLKLLGIDLLPLLLARRDDVSAAERLKQTALAQPALFVVEYALARLFIAWGIRPLALLGHSIGEYTASCVAEVLSLDDALQLVVTRGRLMQSLPSGAMLSVRLGEAALARYLGSGVALAAVNAPDLSVLSGPTEAIAECAAAIMADGGLCRLLQTSHAFHSPMMRPVLEPFRDALRSVRLAIPRLPLISCLTGRPLKAEATDPEYYVQQLEQPVRFSAGIEGLLADGAKVFLELGPGTALGTFVSRHRAPKGPVVAISTLSHPTAGDGDDGRSCLAALGQLWAEGATPMWRALHWGDEPMRVTLPPYPFERRRHWVDAPGATALASSVSQKQVTKTVPGRSPGEEEEAVIRLWSDQLGHEAIGPDDDFHRLGGDSLLAVRIAALLNQRFGSALRPHDLIEAPTPGQLAQLIRAQARTSPASGTDFSLVTFRRGASDRRPLFLFHAVGGTVHFYQDLVAALDVDLPVYGFQSQALDGHSPSDPSVAAMIERYLVEMRRIQPHGPYRLAGSSFGGMLAYEAAHQLLVAGESVEFLAMMDAPGPGSLPQEFADDAEILSYLATMFARPLEAGVLRELDESERIARFLATCADKLPAGITADEFRLYLRIFKDNTEAMRRYEAPLCMIGRPILFFRAADRDAHSPQRPELGWQKLLGHNALRVTQVSGNHLTMMEAAHLSPMAELLSAAITPSK